MKKGLEHAAWVTAADAGARVIGFVVIAFLARTLSPDLFGVMSIGLAALGYLSQVSGAGLQVVETRNIASGALMTRERIGGILTLRVSIALILLALTIVVVRLGPVDNDTGDALVLSALILIPFAFSLDWLFQGLERFEVLSASRLINALMYALVVFFLVRVPDDFRIALLGVGAGVLVGVLVLLSVFVGTGGQIRLSVDPGLWKDLLRSSLPVGAALVISQSAVNLGPIVLGVAESAREAGFFAAAMRVVIALLIADRVLNSLFLPYLSRIHATKPEEFGSTVKLAVQGVSIFSLPAAVVVFLLASPLTHVAFGAGYEETALHLRLLLPYFVLTLLNSVVTCALIASGREHSFSKFQMAGSTVLMTAVAVLVPVIGPLGAGIGIGIGEMVILLLLVRVLRGVQDIEVGSTLLKFGIAIACAGVVIAGGGGLELPVLIPLSIAALVAGMFLTGAVSFTDARLLWARLI